MTKKTKTAGVRRLTPRRLHDEIEGIRKLVVEIGQYADQMERWHMKLEDGNGMADPIQQMTFEAMEGLDRIRKSLVNREPREPMRLPNGTMLSFGDNRGLLVQGELFR